MAPKVLLSILILIAAATVSLCHQPDRSNIVFILTDDQDIVLGGTTPMAKTRKHFTENGLFFVNAFTQIPICCPSRSSILTGRYQHNHHVLNNTVEGNCDGDQWRTHSEPVTFAKYLHDSGYETFLAGKYLNTYALFGPTPYRVPLGWDDWHGLVGNSVYYDYTLSVNGVPEDHGSAPEDYLTDVIHERGIEFLESRSKNKPFFMMLSTPACHYPWTPSPKYLEAYSDMSAPRTATFGMHSDTKNWIVRRSPGNFDDVVENFLDDTFRGRWGTLLSVDDMVDDVISNLKKRNLFNNTYIFYFSDHGYHLGQFGLPVEKMHLYETDIRVPFMVSGPGIKPGLKRKEPVVSIDLAPTFLDLAGVHFDRRSMDGTSLVPLLKSKTEDVASDWRTSFLVEYRGQGNTDPAYLCPQLGNNSGMSICIPECICEDAFNNSYDCLRWLDVPNKKDMIACSFYDDEDFVEVYDMQTDPNQTNNLAYAIGDSFKAIIRFFIKTLIRSD